MKRVLSLILVLVLFFSLCACGAKPEPVTVELTEENFEQYFELKSSIRNSGADTGHNKGDLYIQASATATIEVVPKFTGIWSDLEANFVWEVSDSWRYWSFGSHAESNLEFELPDESKEKPVNKLRFSFEYLTEQLPYSYRPEELEVAYDVCPRISNLRAEDVSGTITVIEMLE